jgi:hypothetical protein
LTFFILHAGHLYEKKIQHPQFDEGRPASFAELTYLLGAYVTPPLNAYHLDLNLTVLIMEPTSFFQKIIHSKRLNHQKVKTHFLGNKFPLSIKPITASYGYFS